MISHLSIYSIYGQLLQSHANINEQTFSANLANLPGGVYEVNIQFEYGFQYSDKVLKR